MPWFRFRRRKDEEQAADAAPVVEEVPAPTEEQEAEADEDAGIAADGAATRKRRRRGSRGGRGRRKAGATGDADGQGPQTATVEPKGAKEAPAKAAPERAARGRSGQRSATRDRRRQPQRRAPLPAAKRELLISVDVGEQRVALLEDDRVAEVYLERPERRSIAGNIYLGTVDNVLPGMEAAFVEIGLEKNGFLYVDEIVVPELEGKRHGKKITDLLQRGQQILVQAVKDPIKTKGARLTTEISLPGRFLVYVPNGEGLGVSRRLDDAERTRLKEILKGIAPPAGGVIVRTAAEGASAEDVERDLVFLQRLWKGIQARAKVASPRELVYQEAELPLRIVRDLFAGDFAAAHVDSERTYKRIVGYLKKTSPHMVERVHRTKDKEPLFEKFDVEKEIESTLDRRVDLPSGGYLVFDYAEAFTVVDVNTGSFVGSRSKSSTQRLEDTATKNNLEAVKEVVRQLRLRDIGGIIVIDFIDMANPKNRHAVEDALRLELERDRTKTYVVEISPLGLVEMTRQKVTEGPRELMTRKCPTCGGDGIVVSDATVALQVERRLRALAAAGVGSRIQAYRIGLHPRTLTLLVGPGAARLTALEEVTRRSFYLVAAEGHVHADHFEVLAEGRRDDLAPQSPFEDGTQAELKLVEIDLYDPTSAVGKLDGHQVVVADAAKLVGKKAAVRLWRTIDGRVFATLVAAQPAVAPITFESEAEKPTRAPSRRKSDEAPETGGDAETEAETEAEPLEIAAPETVLEAEDDVSEDDASEDGAPGAAPKKRTRRGSRGGRRRRKPATAAAEAANGDGPEPREALEPAVVAEIEERPDSAEGATPPTRSRRRQPRIHVPVDTAGETGEQPERPDQPDQKEQPEQPTAETVTEPSAEPAEGQIEDVLEFETAPGVDGAPPKKRTRRGTRGGRNRKKRPAVTNGDGAASPADATPEPEAEPEPETELPAPSEPVATSATVEAAASGDDEGYVPMSEWIEDFDRRG